MVTLQLANHETGVVQDIAALRRQAPDLHFHTDATQAVGKMPVHFHQLGVSTLACSAHKFHGPAGIGVLLVNRCVKLSPRTFGGHQQNGLRPGTEPVALAVGMAKALQSAVEQMEQRQNRCRMLRHVFLEHLQRRLGPVIINGDPEHGLPHTLNIAFPGCASELLFIRLDLAGIDCSTGSACSSGSLLPSPVLRAMNVPANVLSSSMRFSLSHLLSEEDIIDAAQRIAGEVEMLRSSSFTSNFKR
jgi:cysteine desulfurase